MTIEGALAWLVVPLSGAGEHSITMAVAWHGRLMVLAWGFLTPLGVIAARYFKVTPHQDWPRELDNKIWWNTHRMTQYSAVLLTLLAVALVWAVAEQATPRARLHGLLGWTIVYLSCAQVASAWVRGTKGGPTGTGAAAGNWRGDHYDMTRRRIFFEYFHKIVGTSLLALSVAAIVLGLLLADAPRWMAIMLGGWWTLLTLVVIRLQTQGRCLDTYQAIWGPGRDHPGNHMTPVALGCRRLPPSD